jgi:hypothetical protein
MKILLLVLFSSAAWAQPFNLGVKYDTADPVGVCVSRSTMVWNYANGKLWACKTGTWTNVTGTGAGMGCIPSSSAGKILVDDGAGGCTSTTPTISGSTITASLTGTASGNPPNARAINTTSPVTGGGDLSADRTIACATCVTSAAALTSNLPVIGAGSQTSAVGTRSGNTTAFVTTTGTQTSGDCVKIDANGNHIANGSACGSSGTTYGTLCSAYVTANEGTSSTSYVDLTTADSCGFTLSGTTTIVVQYSAYENNSSSNASNLWYNIVNVDGTDVTSPTSEAGMNPAVGGNGWGGVGYAASLSSGAHTIKIRHKVAGSFTGFWTNRTLLVVASP